MKGCFENNRVGQLQQRVWDASDEAIDAILESYEIPRPVKWTGRDVTSKIPCGRCRRRRRNATTSC